MAERRSSRRSASAGSNRGAAQRGGAAKPVDEGSALTTDPESADFDVTAVGVAPTCATLEATPEATHEATHKATPEATAEAVAPLADSNATWVATPAVPIDAVVEGFGVRIGTLALLTAPRKPAEYLADATVFPLPWAPSRVRGMTQLRGQPVTVFDLSAVAPDDLPVRRQHALLVIGPASEAAIAILVDAPPRPLRLKAFARSQRPIAPTLTFAGALHEPMYEIDEADGPGAGHTVWWHADFDRLVDELVADR